MSYAEAASAFRASCERMEGYRAVFKSGKISHDSFIAERLRHAEATRVFDASFKQKMRDMPPGYEVLPGQEEMNL